ncbi:MAG: hypothetical protein MUC58_11575, partial [Rhizobiaceae bacterium]|nr:hypothetical protein [Rhizobiaceae bacterium]
MTIGEAILAQQRILALELELARQKFGQMGNRGSSLESAFRSFLCSHLPRRLSIGTGEVVALVGDEGEQVSSQIDVIISDDTQPLNYAIDTPGLYLIEGVRFCGEIKSSFKSSKLIDEILKSRNVKSMRNLYYAKSLLQKDE